jgi:hypothetical protein
MRYPLEVRLKGDMSTPKEWFSVRSDVEVTALYRQILDGIDQKRPVHAELIPFIAPDSLTEASVTENSQIRLYCRALRFLARPLDR